MALRGLTRSERAAVEEFNLGVDKSDMLNVGDAAENASCWNTMKGSFSACKSGTKILAFILLVTLNWVYTGEDRDRHFGLMHQLIKKHQLVFTYHHDSFVEADSEEHYRSAGNSDISDDSYQKKKDWSKLSKRIYAIQNNNSMALLDMKHKKEMHDKREKELKKLAEEALAHDDWRFRHHKEYVAILKGENGKLANGEDLYMSTDLWLCVKEQIYAEFGDKTFWLLILFTFIWTHLH